MTKILVVDDEQAQSRGLSRAILLRRPDLSVLISHSGREAIEILKEQDIDLVVTDLQMADLDGFDLLAWLVSHRPSVLAFAMTAYGDDEVESRLNALGAIECFGKPLDVDLLLARLTECLSQSIRGHVDNVGLASFLQLVELEKKTCTLEVRHERQVGQLFMRKGELLDARTGELVGEEAALAIIGWLNVDLTIESSCPTSQRVIWKPAYHVVMEAMRLRDEGAHKRSSSSIRPAYTGLSETFPTRGTSERPLLTDSTPPRRSLDKLHVPMGALAVAVIELATGRVLACEDRAELDVAELARAAHTILRQQSATLALAAGNSEAVQELVLMTASRGELMRPLPDGGQFVLLVFDANQTNLVMARHELDLFVREYTSQLAS